MGNPAVRLTFSFMFILLMQPFTFALMKSIFWLFKGRLQRGHRWLIGITLFTVGNGLLALSMMRVWFGAFRLTAGWMVLLLFTLFTALATWLIWLSLRQTIEQTRLSRGLRIFVPLFLAGLFGLAIYNAYVPTVRHYAIQINKPLAQPIRIGMVSDLHLGKLFGSKQLDDLASIMQREQVDMILMPGDIMDDNTIAYEAENMQPHLAKLRAPLGVYATLGNHDLFGAQKQITAAIQAAGITVLNDQAIEINGINIIGRPDDLDKQRQATANLLKQVDTHKPVILLDHRPSQIEQHAQLPIDIQVSGHVHNGQVFPANLIVWAINRVHYGYERIHNGHFFVTSGYGFWGVPFRLGSQSEVMIIDVQGTP